MAESHLRIGEVSRRTGLSPEVLRAWERRYALLRPTRTAGGFRLYSDEDLARIQRMRTLIAEGLAASEAAHRAVAEHELSAQGRAAGLGDLRHRLDRALLAYDEAEAQRVLDRALAEYELETVLGEVLVPFLRHLGERWGRGEVGVAQEHFASNVLRGRLLALARGWDRGHGPRVLLACPPGELHDLPLLMFGLVVRRHGWRVTFLGQDTPADTLQAAGDALAPDQTVLAGAEPAHFALHADALEAVAARRPVAVAGRGADGRLASRIGARLLTEDLVAAGVHLETP